MKASSVGLETEVYLTSEEIKQLRKSPIEGVLNFRGIEIPEIEREIPLALKYDESQKEFLEVGQTPRKTYFGNVDKIVFVINEYLCDDLVKTGACGDRFWNSGKLLIDSID